MTAERMQLRNGIHSFKLVQARRTHAKMELLANVKEFANSSTARVLIVDDNRDGATSLGKLLRLRGFSVDVLMDSTQCLSHLETFKPDIVFLDIAMPNMSGYDVAQ